MFIDLKKFKKGQLYSRPEWNTDTKKESILCNGLNTYLLIAIQDGKTWSVTKDEYVMNHGFLFDDYFEVFDPLHFYTPECKKFVDFNPPVFGTGSTLVQERPNGYNIFRTECGAMDGLNVATDTGKAINLEGVTPFVIKDQSKI